MDETDLGNKPKPRHKKKLEAEQFTAHDDRQPKIAANAATR